MIKMYYKDLPSFTRSANYCITIHLNMFEWSIQEKIDNYKLQLNPKFQRGYKWTEDQQIKFLEYLFKGGKVESIKFNMPSWQNDDNVGNYDEMVCVDGLQRTTALLKFVRNEIKVFGCYYNEFDKPTHRRIRIELDINDLKTEKEVLQWYIDLNTGGTIHTNDEINKVKNMLNVLNDGESEDKKMIPPFGGTGESSCH